MGGDIRAPRSVTMLAARTALPAIRGVEVARNREQQAAQTRIIRTILAEYENVIADVASWNKAHGNEEQISNDEIAWALSGRLAAQRILCALEAGEPIEDRDINALCRAESED